MSVATEYANKLNLTQVNEELDLLENNSQNVWSPELRKELNELAMALLNRKWELQGTRGFVFIR